jgi:hypothetical protein
METIYQTLLHTPAWVYLLFAYLMWRGINALQTQVRALKKLFILPIIFVIMSIHTLISEISISGLAVITWTAAIGCGIGLGWLQIVRLTLAVDREHCLIRIPGSWFTLLIILVIFVTKYYFNFKIAVDGTALKHAGFIMSFLFVSGISTGLFVGRLSCYLSRFYRATESVNLSAFKNDYNANGAAV